jgi:hypothetical protein
MPMRVAAEFGIKFRIKLEIEVATKLPGKQARGITAAEARILFLGVRSVYGAVGFGDGHR